MFMFDSQVKQVTSNGQTMGGWRFSNSSVKLFLLAFFLVSLTSFMGMPLQSGGISVFWPAAGVITGLAIILNGSRLWAALAGAALGMSAVHVFASRPFGVSTLFTFVNLAQSSIIAFTLKHWLAFNPQFKSLREAAFLAASTALTVGLMAIPVAVVLNAIGGFPDMVRIWSAWFTSHVTGIVIIAPLVIFAHSLVQDGGSHVRTGWAPRLDWNIRQRLIMLVIVLATPMNLVIGGAIWYLAHSIRQSQRSNLIYAARSAGSAVEAQLAGQIELA